MTTQTTYMPFDEPVTDLFIETVSVQFPGLAVGLVNIYDCCDNLSLILLSNLVLFL
jgi:hypothetical protein